MGERKPLPVSEETMRAIWEFFCRTSMPRIMAEKNKGEETA